MAGPKRILSPKRVIGAIHNPVREDWHGQGMVTLSYDDATLGHWEYALPLHEKYSMPGTINVITNRLKNPAYMTERMVRDASFRGIEIASHSHYHNVQLTDKTNEQIHEEASVSQAILEDITGEPVRSIAIPFSAYDVRVRDIIAQYYDSARVYTPVENNALPPTDRWWLKSRVITRPTTTMSLVQTALDEAVTNGTWCIIMLHRIVPDDTDPMPELSITVSFLEQIMHLINSYGRDTLLPINQRDAIRYSVGLS